MKWTIGVLTVPEREGLFGRIHRILTRQSAGLDIEILVADDPHESVAAKRQWCLDNAAGEYICFVDDDDLVPPYYVESIYPLLDGVDYIGFQLQLYINGLSMKPTYHSLRYDKWSEDDQGYYRNVSHLNPIRTEIARQGRYEGGYSEDSRWAKQVHPKTEHYIDKVMYEYHFSPATSLTLFH